MSAAAERLRQLKAALQAEEEMGLELEVEELELQLAEKQLENQTRKRKVSAARAKLAAARAKEDEAPQALPQAPQALPEAQPSEHLELTDRKEQATAHLRTVRVSANHFSLSSDHIQDMVAETMKEVSNKTMKLRLIFESDKNSSHHTDATLVGTQNISADNLQQELNKLLLNSFASDSSGTWQWVELEVISKV